MALSFKLYHLESIPVIPPSLSGDLPLLALSDTVKEGDSIGFLLISGLLKKLKFL